MKIVLLGAPGSGKGTQAGYISEYLKLPHISTGDIFRENIKNKTPLGLQIKEIIDKGHFCPDDLTIKIVVERLNMPDCKNGYILDGFPRNLVQAEELEKFNTPDTVINLDVAHQTIIERLSGRRVCPDCKATYNADTIGDSMVCEKCGGKLIIRDDDNPESVKERLVVYESQTAPLIDFYKKAGKLKVVHGHVHSEDVFKDILKVIK